jgi:hypothetical protein
VFNGTAQDVELTIEWEQLPGWIADVKRIIQKDLFEDGKARWALFLPFLWPVFVASGPCRGPCTQNAPTCPPTFMLRAPT